MRIEEILEQTTTSNISHAPFLNAYQERDVYYHGTSDALDMGDKLLPPNVSNKLSEVGRNKNLDKVFFTEDERSAKLYARKAVKQFGGNPVIYVVSPVGKISTLNDQAGTTVYYSDWAYIKRKV